MILRYHIRVFHYNQQCDKIFLVQSVGSLNRVDSIGIYLLCASITTLTVLSRQNPEINNVESKSIESISTYVDLYLSFE